MFYDITGSYDASFYIAGTVILISGLLGIPLPYISRWENRKKNWKAVSADIQIIVTNDGDPLPSGTIRPVEAVWDTGRGFSSIRKSYPFLSVWPPQWMISCDIVSCGLAKSEGKRRILYTFRALLHMRRILLNPLRSNYLFPSIPPKLFFPGQTSWLWMLLSVLKNFTMDRNSQFTGTWICCTLDLFQVFTWSVTKTWINFTEYFINADFFLSLETSKICLFTEIWFFT